jgi:hypothetical protein
MHYCRRWQLCRIADDDLCSIADDYCAFTGDD